LILCVLIGDETGVLKKDEKENCRVGVFLA
jgi:hypothetical protein